MIALYARNSPDDILTRVGRKYATLDKACSKARTLAAFEAEIRDRTPGRPRPARSPECRRPQYAIPSHDDDALRRLTISSLRPML